MVLLSRYLSFLLAMPRWLKACIGVALLAFLALNVDWSSLRMDAHSIRWPLLGCAALFYPLAIFLNAVKWGAALRLHDIDLRFAYRVRTGCIGFFFNNLLPSAIGGDIYRVYRSSAGGATSQAISAVVLERLVGLSVLLLNGLVGAVLLANSSSLARAYLIWCVGGFVVACAGLVAAAVCRGRIASAAASIRFLQPVVANLRRIARRHPAWAPLVLWSVAFQASAVAATFVVFAAVGAELAPSGALLITAAAGLAAVVPISISGIGVVEGSIVGAGVALGVDYHAAFLAAIVLRAFSLVTSLCCGIVYVAEGGRQTMQTA